MINLSDWGKALGTRNVGEIIRSTLLTAMESSELPVRVSFKNVIMVSGSFADECFGKLIATIGVEKFKSSFEIHDLDDDTIRMCLNHTFKKRLMQESKKRVH